MDNADVREFLGKAHIGDLIKVTYLQSTADKDGVKMTYHYNDPINQLTGNSESVGYIVELNPLEVKIMDRNPLDTSNIDGHKLKGSVKRFDYDRIKEYQVLNPESIPAEFAEESGGRRWDALRQVVETKSFP